MLRAIYPGSFDPVTYGHLDIIRRSCKIVDELVVGVLNNNAKMPLFSVEERVKMLEEATKDLTNVRIVPFHGLLIDFARQMDAFVIIRGLRAITDFEYELQMSQTNHKLEPDLETMFLTTSIEYSYLSSTTVREIAAYGGDVSQFVPEAVAGELEAKMKAMREAQKEFAKFSQEQVDKIFYEAAMAANKMRIPLAKMAVEETQRGVLEDKIIKNHYAAEYIYNAYKDTKTCGVIEEDTAYGIKKVAEPIGLVAAVIPTTNPTSTAIFKTLICLKTRNAIIISPHPSAKACTIEAAKVVLDAAVKAGAPEGIICRSGEEHCFPTSR